MSLLKFMGDIPRFASLFSAFVVLPLLAMLITVDVVMRYVFNSPFIWSLEAAEYLLLLFFICGLAWSIRAGVHIRMTLLWDGMGPRYRRIVSLIYAVALIVPFAMIAHKAIEEAQFASRLGMKTNDLSMPVWLWYSLVAIAAAMTALQVLALAVEIVRGRRLTLDDNLAGGH
ncbi:TRAP transporter small permease [Mesorhizobium sp. 1B3]|uniref:TRAP transporter small permease n=1 Tax=Mesorhizobium sp. 1B3 TaxID=3243599 RepID=UPI003D98F978